MKIWEKIKAFLGIKPKMLMEGSGNINLEETTNQETSEQTLRERIAVSPEYLQGERIKQQREEQRAFQLTFALKHICGKGLNLFSEDLEQMLQTKLDNFGYGTQDINMDALDLEILSKANRSMNAEPEIASQLIETINSAEVPTELVNNLVKSVRKQSIEKASQFQYTPDNAHRFVPANILTQFNQEIERLEEIEKGENENSL